MVIYEHWGEKFLWDLHNCLVLVFGEEFEWTRGIVSKKVVEMERID